MCVGQGSRGPGMSLLTPAVSYEWSHHLYHLVVALGVRHLCKGYSGDFSDVAQRSAITLPWLN